MSGRNNCKGKLIVLEGLMSFSVSTNLPQRLIIKNNFWWH